MVDRHDIDAHDIIESMRRTTDQIVGEDQLRAMLTTGRQLRIKYGVDCTAPDLHLGHAVNLWLMRHLQDHGHKVVFLLGDLTTRVGDPTGKSSTRPVLGEEEIARNARAFLDQVGQVLRTDPELFEVRRNSEWFDSMHVAELLEIFALTTHAQLMEREMFRARVAVGREIALHELVYPVLQGYDSVAMDSDLTIVGTDQLFNELMGRRIQQRLGHTEQVVITTRITPGLDGASKQSKSLRNYVALTDTPQEKFGKVMSLADDLVGTWAEVYTERPLGTVDACASAAATGGSAARDAKLDLAEAIVRRYHGIATAASARKEFLAVFSAGSIPSRIPDVEVTSSPVHALDLVASARPELSRSACRRLIRDGAVHLDGERLHEAEQAVEVRDDQVLRTGRRRWSRIRR